MLYGRSGYLLGCLLLNKHLGEGSVPAPAMQAVVGAIIESGGRLCGLAGKASVRLGCGTLALSRLL